MLPGLPGSTMIPRLPVYQVTSDTRTINIWSDIGNPSDPVRLVIWVAPGVLVGSNNTVFPAINLLGLHDGSQILLFNSGHITGAGGRGGRHNQIPRGFFTPDFAGIQHSPGGAGGAGDAVGSGGAGSPGLGVGDNVDPAGPTGNPGTLMAGGLGQQASDQTVEDINEFIWLDARTAGGLPSSQQDYSGVDGGDAIIGQCTLDVWNAGVISGGGGGGAAGYRFAASIGGGDENVGGCDGGALGAKPSYSNAGNLVTPAVFQDHAETGILGEFVAGKNGEAGWSIRMLGSGAINFHVGGVDGVDILGQAGVE